MPYKIKNLDSIMFFLALFCLQVPCPVSLACFYRRYFIFYHIYSQYMSGMSNQSSFSESIIAPLIHFPQTIRLNPSCEIIRYAPHSKVLINQSLLQIKTTKAHADQPAVTQTLHEPSLILIPGPHPEPTKVPIPTKH
jgi:hypothetical protein